MIKLILACYLLGLTLMGGAVSGATLAHSSDFEGSNKDGWQHPVPSGNQTSIQTDGPFNNILLVTSSGGGGAGSRLVVPNSTAPWIGNYTSDGVSAVEVDLVNNSGITLSIRVGIEGGAPGNRWVSTTPVSLSPSDRGTFRFNLDSGSLTAAGGNNVASALADVSQIRIFHNPTGGDFKGANVSGSFTMDNVTLVPEPSIPAMFIIGGTLLLARRKK